MIDGYVWFGIAGLLIAVELFTGTFYLLMIALGLGAGGLVAFLIPNLFFKFLWLRRSAWFPFFFCTGSNPVALPRNRYNMTASAISTSANRFTFPGGKGWTTAFIVLVSSIVELGGTPSCSRRNLLSPDFLRFVPYGACF